MESDPLSAERVANARSAVMRRAAIAKTGYAPLVEPLSEQCAESILAALALAERLRKAPRFEKRNGSRPFIYVSDLEQPK